MDIGMVLEITKKLRVAFGGIGFWLDGEVVNGF
jgi:hypothetical protein